MKRLYRAYADTGRDYVTFLFESEYRANSRKNLDDARHAYFMAHGHSIFVASTARTEYVDGPIL